MWSDLHKEVSTPQSKYFWIFFFFFSSLPYLNDLKCGGQARASWTEVTKPLLSNHFATANMKGGDYFIFFLFLGGGGR